MAVRVKVKISCDRAACKVTAETGWRDQRVQPALERFAARGWQVSVLQFNAEAGERRPRSLCPRHRAEEAAVNAGLIVPGEPL